MAYYVMPFNSSTTLETFSTTITNWNLTDYLFLALRITQALLSYKARYIPVEDIPTKGEKSSASCYDDNYISHTDLKPENMLIKKTGHKLTIQVIDPDYEKADYKEGESWTYITTATYRAPEVHRNNFALVTESTLSAIDYNAAEIFSLGIIFLNLLLKTEIVLEKKIPLIQNLNSYMSINWSLDKFILNKSNTSYPTNTVYANENPYLEEILSILETIMEEKIKDITFFQIFQMLRSMLQREPQNRLKINDVLTTLLTLYQELLRLKPHSIHYLTNSTNSFEKKNNKLIISKNKYEAKKISHSLYDGFDLSPQNTGTGTILILETLLFLKHLRDGKNSVYVLTEQTAKKEANAFEKIKSLISNYYTYSMKLDKKNEHYFLVITLIDILKSYFLKIAEDPENSHSLKSYTQN
jgi:serine/threonine protein kinase